jgi:hypothetical protein
MHLFVMKWVSSEELKFKKHKMRSKVRMLD